LKVRGSPWCATPRGNKGGVWQAGQGLVATPEGDLFLMTGDGSFDGVTDFGQSVVKLSGKDLTVLDSFTPWDWAEQNAHDDDLGAAGPLYIASGPFVVGGGKSGVLYSLDAKKLGKVGDHQTHKDHSLDRTQAATDPPAWKTHPPPHGADRDHHIHGSPIYYPPLQRLYLWGENDVLRAFTLDAHGHFTPPTPRFGDVIASSGMPGGMLALTADGAKHPIVWALMPAPAPFDPSHPFKADANRTRLVKGVLRAIDASSLKEIWNSDGPGAGLPWHFAKFSPPTVANGRAYVPTYDGHVVVFGLG
jgi:outer membrane protein assembly factor BamB